MTKDIDLQNTEYGELDYFVINAQFTPEALELSYIDPKFQTEEAGIVTTIAMTLEEEPEAAAILRQVQEGLNWLVITATQKIRDAQ